VAAKGVTPRRLRLGGRELPGPDRLALTFQHSWNLTGIPAVRDLSCSEVKVCAEDSVM